jgi:hypothetical protein
MKQIRTLGMVLVAVFAMSAVAASAAFASEGPTWVVGGSPLSGSKNITARQKTKFTLKAGSVITIECAQASSTGSITAPRKDTSTISFTECAVAGKSSSECTVNSPGEPHGTIDTAANTELVYIGSEKEAKEEKGKLGDDFSPVSGETFVTLTVEGPNCPNLSSGTNEVKGSVVAEVGAGEKVEGTLNFPSTTIKEAFSFESKGKVKKLKPALTVFGFIGCSQVGEEIVETEGKEAFGAIAN